MTRDQVKKVAEKKMPDLRVKGLDEAMLLVEGTARSMGVDIEGAAQ